MGHVYQQNLDIQKAEKPLKNFVFPCLNLLCQKSTISNSSKFYDINLLWKCFRLQKTFDYTKSIIVISEDKIQIIILVYESWFSICVVVFLLKYLVDQLKIPLITSNSLCLRSMTSNSNQQVWTIHLKSDLTESSDKPFQYI